MLGPNRRYITATTTKPEPRVTVPNQQNSNIIRTSTGDTASKQNSAFKKENDVETPSPSGLGQPDLGFPLSSKRGAAEGLGSASKKENDTRGRRRCQHRQAKQGSLSGLKLSNTIAAESVNEDGEVHVGRNHHVGRGLTGLHLPS
jgi:hypothetical protein